MEIDAISKFNFFSCMKYCLILIAERHTVRCVSEHICMEIYIHTHTYINVSSLCGLEYE